MTNATITSIAKHIRYKGPAARKSPNSIGHDSNTPPASCCRPKNHQPIQQHNSGDRYQQSGNSDYRNEERLNRQNRMALAARNRDQSMQQIVLNLDQMKASLNTMAQLPPPTPQGSEERTEILKNVVSLQKEIELLTFPRGGDQNIPSDANEEDINDFAASADSGAVNRWLPELTENADDNEIASSIGMLENAGNFISRQRDQLKLKTSTMFEGNDVDPVGTQTDDASVEFKSLSIGKHLNRHPQANLTTAQDRLKEYLT